MFLPATFVILQQFGPRLGLTVCVWRSSSGSNFKSFAILSDVCLKVNFEKSQQMTDNKSMKNYPACKEWI